MELAKHVYREAFNPPVTSVREYIYFGLLGALLAYIIAALVNLTPAPGRPADTTLDWPHTEVHPCVYTAESEEVSREDPWAISLVS